MPARALIQKYKIGGNQMILYVLLGIIGYISLVVTGNVVGGLLVKLIAKSPRLIKIFGLDQSDYM